MGDRSSIIIRQHDFGNDQGIEIYGHWAGTDIVNNLPKAITRARDRWDDESYFTRIIIHNILEDIAVANSSLGCGIEITDNYQISNHADLEYNPVIIDRVNQQVLIGQNIFSFESIISVSEDKILKEMKTAMLD